MNLTPRPLSPTTRGFLFTAVVLATVGGILALKRSFLPTYLSAEALLAVTLLAILACVVLVGRRMFRVSPVTAGALGIPLLVLLAVDLVVTPLPYELAWHADRLPHPEGTLRPNVLETALVFQRSHPAATVIFRYAPERDLHALTNETVDAFREAGWMVQGVFPPSGNGSTDYSGVNVARGPFKAQCILGQRSDFVDWEGPMRTIGCRLTV